MFLNKRITTNTSSSSNISNINTMRPSTWMLLTFAFFAAILAVNAVDEKSNTDLKTVLPSTTTNSVTPRDEIYIDDEGLEGSGRHGEVHDDLEKESDYSGSGFGPDDEDSSTHHHSSSTTHQTSSSSSSSSSGSGSAGGSGSGSNIDKTLINRQDITNRKDTTRVTEYELGSGDGDDDDDIELVDEEVDEDDHSIHSINRGRDHHDDNDHDDEDDDEDIDDYNIENYDDTHSTVTSNKDDIDLEITDTDNTDPDDDIDKDDDNNEDMITEVTDPKLHDVKIPDRSGEDTVNRQDIAKTNNEIDLDPPTDTVNQNNEVLIMNTKNEDRTASFFAQPGILAAVIGGAVVGLLCAILVVMFIVYRMRKKDEGSYALDEPKRSPAVNSYAKNANNREFYA